MRNDLMNEPPSIVHVSCPNKKCRRQQGLFPHEIHTMCHSAKALKYLYVPRPNRIARIPRSQDTRFSDPNSILSRTDVFRLDLCHGVWRTAPSLGWEIQLDYIALNHIIILFESDQYVFILKA